MGDAGNQKRVEPHGRQWDATSPRPSCGESCRGGERPRGWNEISEGRTELTDRRPRTSWSGRRNGVRRRGAPAKLKRGRLTVAFARCVVDPLVMERVEGAAKCKRVAWPRFDDVCPYGCPLKVPVGNDGRPRGAVRWRAPDEPDAVCGNQFNIDPCDPEVPANAMNAAEVVMTSNPSLT